MVASQNVGCFLRLVQAGITFCSFIRGWQRKRLNFAEMWQVAVVKGMFNIQCADRARKYFFDW